MFDFRLTKAVRREGLRKLLLRPRVVTRAVMAFLKQYFRKKNLEIFLRLSFFFVRFFLFTNLLSLCATTGKINYADPINLTRTFLFKNKKKSLKVLFKYLIAASVMEIGIFFLFLLKTILYVQALCIDTLKLLVWL